MSVLTWEPTTVVAIADALGVPRLQVASWAVAWHGPIGTGNRRRLDTVDRFVARAWQVLGGARSGHRYGYASDRYRLVEAAIRSDPRTWLLVAGYVIETHDSAEDAARVWLDSGQPAGQVIDLWSRPDD